MVQLEAVRVPAALPRVVDERAAPLVALEDGAADCGGRLSSAPARLFGLGSRSLSHIVRFHGRVLRCTGLPRCWGLLLCRLPRCARYCRALRPGTLPSF